jgi:hypothetical protein
VAFTLGWRRLADAAAGDEAPDRARYAEPAPAQVTANYRTFCGT